MSELPTAPVESGERKRHLRVSFSLFSPQISFPVRQALPFACWEPNQQYSVPWSQINLAQINYSYL